MGSEASTFEKQTVSSGQHSSSEQQSQPSTTNEKMAHAGSNRREVQVPVSYGQIAVRMTNDCAKCSSVIIAIHDLYDNAALFDQIARSLPKDTSLVAVDLPGHGASSHLPPNQPYNDDCWVTAVESVAKHLKINKCILLGHGYGVWISLLVASKNPNLVSKVCAMSPCISVQGLEFPPMVAPCGFWRTWDEFLARLQDKAASRGQPNFVGPVLFPRARTIVFKRDKGAMCVEAGIQMLQRMCRYLDDFSSTICISTDSRIRDQVGGQVLTMNQLTQAISKIKCPIHMLYFMETYRFNADDKTQEYQDRVRQLVGQIEKTCGQQSNIKVKELDGNHYELVNNPALMLKEIRQLIQA